MTHVKICGLTTEESVHTAVSHGAGFIGCVFFPPSPRNITPEAAGNITRNVPEAVKKVAVTVDMKQAELAEVIRYFRPDMLQLHGKETPEQVKQVKAATGLPVIKAIAIREKSDIAAAIPYYPVADMLLFDAKAPKDAKLPGGNGVSFDWSLLQGEEIPLPWFLSGGLTCQNIREALELTKAQMIDVSSGVESSPGVKDNARIIQLLQIVTK